MKTRILTSEVLENFRANLILEEKSPVTIEKYVHDVKMFFSFIGGKTVTKELVLEYKHQLMEQYAVRSVNSKLASLNSLFAFLDWSDCKMKSLKLQQQTYLAEEQELTKTDYFRLVAAARSNPRLQLILETICSTGIRVSELQYFTLEAVKTGTITVRCKNKTRNIFIPSKLKKKLLDFAKGQHMTGGILFRTKSGRSLNRSHIWAQMKKLCTAAQVNPRKVFPHNLRKLFARTFYCMEKDIAKLADILGHSSIDTTRIYIMSTGAEHRRKIEQLGLVL